METVFEACMAVLLDAAMLVLLFHMVHKKEDASVWEKVFCVTMLFGVTLGMALGEAQHARAFQVICGLGVILSYAAEGVAFAGNAQEVTCHE